MLCARHRTSFTPYPAPRAHRVRARSKEKIINSWASRNFKARVKNGDFLEHARVHEHFYGTLRQPLMNNLKRGVDVLIDIDTQGAAAIRNCGDEFIRRALTDVFIMPPDLDELRRRLTKRGTETPEQIELRLVNAAREMELWRDYRYTIISQSMEEDLQKFRHIIGAERYLSSRLIPA